MNRSAREWTVDRLDPALSSAIDALFSAWNNDDGPGLLLGITDSSGAPLKTAAFGLADLAHGIALDDRSVIRIASQSKQFTVLLTLMMEAEGRLSMQDDLRDHCPWMPDFGVPITLEQMASNTSGLADVLDTMITTGVPIVAPSSRQAARQIVSRHRRLNFAPGSDLLYSNTNFLLLTEILEQVSGMSYPALLRERITGPLGMTSTRLMVRDDEILPRLAGHHRRGPAGEWLRAAWGIAIGGEGGLVSCLHDLLIWQRNMVDPAPVVGTPEMFARMKAPGIVINGRPSPYGLGLVRTRHRGMACSGHGGWIAGSRSETIRVDETGIGVTILANHDDLSPFVLARRVADLLHGLPEPEAPSPAARALCAAAGLYRERGGGRVLAIADEGGSPRLVSSLGESELDEVEPGSFAARGPIPRYRLRLLPDGSLDAETLGGALVFVPAAGAPAERAPLAGRFGNDDVGIVADMAEGAEGPAMRIRSDLGASELALTSCDSDLYLARPLARETHDQWRVAPWVLPWLFSIAILPDAIVLNSDRGAGLVLRRLP